MELSGYLGLNLKIWTNDNICIAILKSFWSNIQNISHIRPNLFSQAEKKREGESQSKTERDRERQRERQREIQRQRERYRVT